LGPSWPNPRPKQTGLARVRGPAITRASYDRHANALRGHRGRSSEARSGGRARQQHSLAGDHEPDYDGEVRAAKVSRATTTLSARRAGRLV
jgi:hypothetical protein